MIVTNEKCILCKYFLNSSKIVYGGKIRGDNSRKCKIVSCSKCDHIQLIGFRENLKQHYDDDNQSNDLINNIKMKLEEIINKEIVEIYRRIKYIDIKKTKSILDVGAGYCSFAKKLRELDSNVMLTCLEPSKKRTDLGKINNKITSDDNIGIINSYIDDKFTIEHENVYDYVTLWHVLEHLDDTCIDSIILNMYRCCKPGGKILIEVPHGKDELFKIEKYCEINYMIHHLSYWTEDSLSKLMNRLGIEKYKINYVQRYGFRNYMNWIYNLGEDQKCDMNNGSEFQEWVEYKVKAKNTDALLLIIEKEK